MTPPTKPPAPPPETETVKCTGETATWCPAHGDCRCAKNGEGRPSLDDPACPLHAPGSAHAGPPPSSPGTAQAGEGVARGLTLTRIVNGQDVQTPAQPEDRIGVLAHWALASSGYDWLTIELRDREGRTLPAGTRAADITGPTFIGKPIGWGG